MRKRYPLPDDVRQALEAAGVMEDYRQRPAYQRNDYVLWIGSAVRQDTRDRRINQMIDELAKGGVYMKMPHSPSVKNP